MRASDALDRFAQADPFRLDELFTDSERDVRQRVRNFAQNVVLPIVNEHWEAATFPYQIIAPLRELGVAGGSMVGYGCPGLSAVAAGLVTYELARVDGSVQTFFGAHSGLAMGAIALLGDEEQKKHWLPPMSRMELLGGFAMTEPEHGSDAVSIETRARRTADAWVIDGVKRWIGNSTFADVLVVWARDDDDNVGAFLVDTVTPGFEATPITGKTSKRIVAQADIALRGVRVPLDRRLAHARSFGDATRVLTTTRYNAAWAALGHATAAYELALEHVMRREQFGKPLAAFQLVQYRLATMLAEIGAMQLLCLRASQLVERGAITPATASLVKMNNAAKARAIVADARDLLGGDGILLERHVARHQTDMEAVYSYEGTDAMQALIIGREITGIAAFS